MMHLRTALALLVFLLAPLAGRADGFLSIADDLPLMPGLQEAVEAAVVFDTAVGRLAETQAAGAPSPADISEFYAATLPQLGWTRLDDDRYRRGEEVLRLYLTPASGGGTAARFALSPAAGGNGKTKK